MSKGERKMRIAAVLVATGVLVACASGAPTGDDDHRRASQCRDDVDPGNDHDR